MARKKPDVWEAKPDKSIRYGPLARFVDWRIGRSDGRSGRVQLPGGPPEDLKIQLTTPYLDQLSRGLGGAADAENSRLLRDAQHDFKRRNALAAEIMRGMERSTEIQKELDAMPDPPPESSLTRRNAVEQHADELLIRARRAREFTAARERTKSAKLRVDEALSACLVEQANVDGAISVRRLALNVRVRRLWSHAMTRRAAYIRHLCRHHPDGTDLLRYFELSSPELPGWLDGWPEGQVDPVI
jgi:hypothetical protein